MSSTPRNTCEAQCDISTPRDTRKVLGEITNITDEASRRWEERRRGPAEMSIEQRDKIDKASTSSAFTDKMWFTLAPSGIDENAGPHDENTPNILANGNVETNAHENHTHHEDDAETLPADRADAKRKKRNARQQKRRAEMTDQQREEINKKQRLYRARKKAAVSQIVPASSPAEWPHRNDNYVPRARGPRTVPFGSLPTSGESDDGDDDCVMLDGDPDKSVAVAKEEGGPSRDAAEDELQIVAEKGEIACRDFPHPRHLCAALPFSTSSHASHCSMCHCYVCDCRAPCPCWLHHCHATDKDSKWKELRQSKIKSQPNPKPSLPQHFNRSVTTGPSSQNATGFSGRSLAPSPMPSTIPSYGSNSAQVAPPLYTSSNGNHLQPSSFPSYGLVQPARPHASQPAQVSLGGHVSAKTFQSYPPQFPVGAPLGSQGHNYQYRPPSYPQLALNTVGVPLSRYSLLNALAHGTQCPEVPSPSPGIMSILARQLGLPADYNTNQPLGQQSTSTPQYQHMHHPRDVLLAHEAARKDTRLLQQLSQFGASSGHNSSNHAPGGTVLSSGSIQIQQPLCQLKPGTALSSSSAQIQQPLPQLNPGTALPSASSQIQQLYLCQSKSQSSVTPSKTAPNTLYLPRK